MRIGDINPNYKLYEREINVGFYDVEQDKKKPIRTDTRKPKLTLRNINRLKKIRATKEIEMAQKKDLLGVMYGLPEEGDGI